MKRCILKQTIALSVLLCLPFLSTARTLTLERAIQIANERSFDAQLARFTFLASYWTFRSWRAELLPAVNLSSSLANFNHSRVATRNYDTGQINYVGNNSLDNSLTLSLDQQLPLTGGTVSLQSYLYRLDQFDYNQTTYNTQPLRVSYTQPLSSYNEMKWRGKTEPKEYEKAKRIYLESMGDVAINVTSLYFAAVSAQSDYRQSTRKKNDLEQLYEISQRRFKLGTITKGDLLQLELSLLNTRVEENNAKLSLDDARYNLFSYLRVNDYDSVTLSTPDYVQDMVAGADDAVMKAFDSSSHSLTQEIVLLKAQQELAQAKATKGLQISLNAELGLSKTADKFSSAYRNLQDNEIVGLTLSMPIFDWGVRKGKVMVAKSNLELAKTQIEQANTDFRQKVRRQALQFSSQAAQCRTSHRAEEISQERYAISKRLFESGSLSVTELNTALQELEAARAQYLTQLRTWWTYYYTLRRYTLYDWVTGRPLTANFDALVEQK